MNPYFPPVLRQLKITIVNAINDSHTRRMKMRQYAYWGVILLVILGIWIWTKAGSNSDTLKISAENAKQRLDNEKGIVLLDVRTPEEHLQKRIPNSILIPVNILAKEAISKLPDKNAAIIVYCKSGNRSASAVKILTNLGYTNIYDLGGINGWPYKTVSGK
jgi:rhodanese-related sulfurtransferase